MQKHSSKTTDSYIIMGIWSGLVYHGQYSTVQRQMYSNITIGWMKHETVQLHYNWLSNECKNTQAKQQIHTSLLASEVG